MSQWSTRARWHTGLSADSVEWCPVTPYTDVLVCGTYQLEKTDQEVQQKQNRLGKLYLFKIDPQSKEVSPIQTIETSGILDQKWCYHRIQNAVILAVVTSEGCIQLYKLTGEESEPKMELWKTKKLGENVLLLSVDWSTNKVASEEPRIVVSDSAGNITLLKLGEDIEVIGVWNSHGFEAWIAAFDYWNPDVFYSGGDDMVFKSYDSRVPECATSTNRSHGAGVTAIRCHVDEEHTLLTGSYDETIRLWDKRSLRRCTSELNVGGGIWRLKWHPKRPDTILVAAMYGGFRILTLSDAGFQVISEYMEHESIAYGADWQHRDGDCVATCSFYDSKMHISDVKF